MFLYIITRVIDVGGVSRNTLSFSNLKKKKQKIDRREIYLQKWKIKFHRSEFLTRTGVYNSMCYGNIVTMTSSHKHSKQMLYIVDVRVEQLLVNM